MEGGQASRPEGGSGRNQGAWPSGEYGDRADREYPAAGSQSGGGGQGLSDADPGIRPQARGSGRARQ